MGCFTGFNILCTQKLLVAISAHPVDSLLPTTVPVEKAEKIGREGKRQSKAQKVRPVALKVLQPPVQRPPGVQPRVLEAVQRRDPRRIHQAQQHTNMRHSQHQDGLRSVEWVKEIMPVSRGQHHSHEMNTSQQGSAA